MSNEKEIKEEVKVEENEVKEEKVEETENNETEVQKEDDKLKEANEKYVRLFADFQNQKKRFEKERYDTRQYALEEVVTPMLGVLDNFERALNMECNDSKFKDGMELILKQLQSELQKVGVQEIDALGKDFDPNFHNAVMMEDTEDYESGKVSEVIQKGYLLNSKVIRPAMVKVAN